jgi:hypothetical protein
VCGEDGKNPASPYVVCGSQMYEWKPRERVSFDDVYERFVHKPVSARRVVLCCISTCVAKEAIRFLTALCVRRKYTSHSVLSTRSTVQDARYSKKRPTSNGRPFHVRAKSNALTPHFDDVAMAMSDSPWTPKIRAAFEALNERVNLSNAPTGFAAGPWRPLGRCVQTTMRSA